MHIGSKLQCRWGPEPLPNPHRPLGNSWPYSPGSPHKSSSHTSRLRRQKVIFFPWLSSVHSWILKQKQVKHAETESLDEWLLWYLHASIMPWHVPVGRQWVSTMPRPAISKMIRSTSRICKQPPQQLQHEKKQMHGRLLVLAPRKPQHGTINAKISPPVTTKILP